MDDLELAELAEGELAGALGEAREAGEVGGGEAAVGGEEVGQEDLGGGGLEKREDVNRGTHGGFLSVGGGKVPP